MWTAKIQLRQKKTLRMNTMQKAKTKENSKDEYNVIS